MGERLIISQPSSSSSFFMAMLNEAWEMNSLAADFDSDL